MDSLSDLNKEETSKGIQKMSFFEGVKKILKEGTKKEKNIPKPLENKRSIDWDTNKIQKNDRVKRDVPNKPKFDFNSTTDLRTKIYKESRPIEEIAESFKINCSGNTLSKKKKPNCL